MISYPISKINIGLNITEKRPDGFHNLETIFYPIQLQDVLEVVESDAFEYSASGIPVDGDGKDNLVVKAYELLKRDYKLPPVKIHLHKNIPAGAGLGGGSSDAVSMMKMLDQLFQLKIQPNKLFDYALSLGSDCPFFIDPRPVFARGRGEVFTDVQVNLSSFHLILVKPSVHVSTAEAYSQVEPHKSRLSLNGLVKFPVTKWKGNIQNQFESSVFAKHPEVKEIKNRLYDEGAVFALMSGSGSAVYGLFRSEKRGIENSFPKDYQIFRHKL
ncbi:4-(cytidine 5'-diphospho)-2-C-methyl-D-erythritol kinase [Sunxiuqinia sp. A32]|uniref:4-(cytidine 5'-diphospho)-2-C-methyl-D-erythritol kinase n=1 Tax=Sunxiuqinia sp. A32 TaxID=3461496 RepID=UPI004045838E